MMRVYISGCHAGPSPSPGLGVARSLREAFPDACLVAKDYSPESSGLHDPVFDEIWVCLPWDDLDLDSHQAQIATRLSEGAVYLSGLDLETIWLGRAGLRGALVPPSAAAECITKPAFTAFANLPGVVVPAWCSLDAEPAALHRFARHHDWRVWVKGPSYDAVLATNAHALETARAQVAKTWGNVDLHMQADVRGHEVSVAFAAYRGSLIDAVFMEKRQVTEQGKTWSGRVTDLMPPLRDALAERLAALDWTGGGELEFVRSDDGRLWLFDVNPRFPAWIYGATLTGRNLPGQLVATATGWPMLRGTAVRAREFTRIVVEIPVRAELPQPAPRELLADATPAAGGKHPSGMPQLQRLLRRRAPRPPIAADLQVPAWLDEVRSVETATPCRVELAGATSAHFERCRALAAALPGPAERRVAYSVKTHPSAVLLGHARRNGFLAEVISPEEALLAREAGFTDDELVLNGPLWGPRGPTPPRCFAAFADSIEALRFLPACTRGITGLRLRPPGIASRFGVDVEEPREFAASVEALRDHAGVDFGVSVHVQSSAIGLGRWAQAIRATIELAAALADVTARPLVALDLGGGWAHDDLDDVFTTLLPPLVHAAHIALPHLRVLLIEPGKLLADPSSATIATVLEVRQCRDGTREAVIDGSVAELPMSRLAPHGVIATRGERAEAVATGDDRILGRLCMESDVIRDAVRLPAWLAAGDRLVFCDTGGYDTSMGYSFGRGRVHD